MGELISPPHIGAVSLDQVDPIVRGYLRTAEAVAHQLTLPQKPLDASRLGKAPVPTSPQFLSARRVNLERMKFLVDNMPESDELFVNIDAVPGGLMIPFVASTVNRKRDPFHPDRTIITARQFKEDAGKVYKLMKTGRSNDDLAVVFYQRNKRLP